MSWGTEDQDFRVAISPRQHAKLLEGYQKKLQT